MSSQYLFILSLFSASPYLLNLPHLGAGPPVGEDEGGEGGGEDDHEAAHEHVGGGCLHPGGRAQRPGSRGLAQPLAGGCREDRRLAGVSRATPLILTHIGPVQVLKLAPLAHETIRTPASKNMSQMISFWRSTIHPVLNVEKYLTLKMIFLQL